MSAFTHSTLVLAQGTRPDLNVWTVAIALVFLALAAWLFVMSFDDDPSDVQPPAKRPDPPAGERELVTSGRLAGGANGTGRLPTG